MLLSLPGDCTDFASASCRALATLGFGLWRLELGDWIEDGGRRDVAWRTECPETGDPKKSKVGVISSIHTSLCLSLSLSLCRAREIDI